MAKVVGITTVGDGPNQTVVVALDSGKVYYLDTRGPTRMWQQHGPAIPGTDESMT